MEEDPIRSPVDTTTQEEQRPKTKDGRYYKPVVSKTGKTYYPGLKRDEQGNWYRPIGKPREYGQRMSEGIAPYDIVQDVKNTRAGISFGQLVNENPKYHRQLRESTYKPAINKPRPINQQN